MKNLAKLNDAKTLSKNEQKSINGGAPNAGGIDCRLFIVIGHPNCPKVK